MTACRGSRISQQYPFRDEITRETTSMETTKRLGSYETALEFRGDSLVYFRAVDRRMQSELREQSRWGGEVIYDDPRNPRKGAKYNDRRNGPIGTYRNTNTRNYQCVSNCAKYEDEYDNAMYFDGDRGTSDCQRDPLLNHANLAEGNSSSAEIGFAGIEDGQAANEIEHYLVSRSTANEYRAVGQSGGCGVSKPSATTNLTRNWHVGYRERTTKRFGSNLGKLTGKCKIPEINVCGDLIGGMFTM